MNTFKRLVLAITLAMLLAGTAIAGETSTPPCADPGETNGPPCPATQVVSNDSVDQTVASSDTVETLMIVTAISEIENLLTIY